MEPDFSFLFHQSSKDYNKGHIPIPLDKNKWPESWKIVYYKTYPRLSKVDLPEVSRNDGFFQILEGRKTSGDFSGTGMSIFEVSTLLKYSCGTTHISDDQTSMRRAQPSAGARYPVEIYPLILKPNEGLEAGLYHYNVKLHVLELLLRKEFSEEEKKSMFLASLEQEADCIFLMTSVFWRSQEKYGERGYRYVLIEAGHIGQNIHLISHALGLKSLSVGATKDEEIEKILDIDGINESLIYSVAVGH